MKVSRPFRFGAAAFSAPSWPQWADNARSLEDLGYSTLLISDHFNPRNFATIPALTAAALATTSLRVGCTVFDNAAEEFAPIVARLAEG